MKKRIELDNLISVTLEQMQLAGSAEEYDRLLTQLERLYALQGNAPQAISKETLAIIAGNLIGIVLIVAYEQKHVMTSKAFANLIRPRS